ncbi:hypothetical protein J0S82_002394, partial [Galemys pyrenaicus]
IEPGIAQPYLELALGKLCRFIAALPGGLRPGFPRQSVICAGVVEFFCCPHAFVEKFSIGQNLVLCGKRKKDVSSGGGVKGCTKLGDCLSKVEQISSDSVKSELRDEVLSLKRVPDFREARRSFYKKLGNEENKRVNSEQASDARHEILGSVLGEDTDDGNLELEIKSESENDNHVKGAVKKPILIAQLNTSLKTLEGKGNQIIGINGQGKLPVGEEGNFLKQMKDQPRTGRGGDPTESKPELFTKNWREPFILLEGKLFSIIWQSASPYGPAPLGRPSPAFSFTGAPIHTLTFVFRGTRRRLKRSGSSGSSAKEGDPRCDDLLLFSAHLLTLGPRLPLRGQDQKVGAAPSGSHILTQRFFRKGETDILGLMEGLDQQGSRVLMCRLWIEPSVSAEMESRRKPSKEDLVNLCVPGLRLPTQSEAAGPGFSLPSSYE